MFPWNLSCVHGYSGYLSLLLFCVAFFSVACFAISVLTPVPRGETRYFNLMIGNLIKIYWPEKENWHEMNKIFWLMCSF